tara:strand:+ start:2465 stop:3130 length:666 start_codon:yes stop_codon:yes gene_type:complete
MKKYSNDKRVVFNEEDHSYFLGEKKLTSVTQYISNFKTPFDKERISLAYAKKHNLTQKEVLDMWAKKGKDACTMGTFVHTIFEDYILKKPIKTNENYPKCKTALNLIVDYFQSKKLTPVETELIVYNENYAGQIDCIAKNEKGDHFILDWKTNGEIKMSNHWQSMKGVYKYLDDCAFNHYSIQLNAYKGMCKEYDIKGCYIVHLKEDSYQFIKASDIDVNM